MTIGFMENLKNADQTELMAVLDGIAPLDTGIQDELQASAYENETSENSGWVAEDASIDSITSDVTTELYRRKQLLGDSYPFAFKDGGLEYLPNKNIFYVFCMLIVLLDSKKPIHNQRLLRSFERISMKLIKIHFGDSFEAHHFGFPRDDKSGFVRAVEALRKRVPVDDELILQNTFIQNIAPSHDQMDLGIDQFVWCKSPIDRKFGNIFFLGQCACGEDYVNKTHDIDLSKIKNYFYPFFHIDPIKMMSVPFCLPDAEIKRLSTSAGMIFDRLALSKIYSKNRIELGELESELVVTISASTPYGLQIFSKLRCNSFEE